MIASAYGSFGDGKMERGYSDFFLGPKQEVPDSERPSALSVSPKAITALGSFAIFANAIIGPGLLSLPKIFDDAGALVPSALLIVGFCVASLATIARCETVALMPGNAKFERMVEFCDPALKFVGMRTFYVCHFLFYLASMSMAVASIVLVAESADIAVAKIFGRSYALTYQDGLSFVTWSVDNCEQQHKCKPFLTGGQVRSDAFISLGYVVTFVVIFPISATESLSEGIGLQYLSFFVTMLSIPSLAGKSLFRAIKSGSHLSVWESGPDAMSASGVVLFNLMYGIFVSTWLPEKKPEVSVKRTVYRSSFMGAILMILYGATVAASTKVVASDGLLDSTEQGEPLPVVIAALAFGFFVIASGIPVSCIMARRNLETSSVKICDPFAASVMCVAFPWAIAWLFYTTPPYRNLVNYSGLFVVSWLALWMPFFILLHAIDPPPNSPQRIVVMPDYDETSDLRPRRSSCWSWIAYVRWFAGLLVAPPDYDVDTVLEPLPPRLQPYSKNIYATLLLLVTIWIFGALLSYLIAFASLTDETVHDQLRTSGG